MIIDECGTKRWLFNGNLHREDGPAIEFADGDKKWYLNDILYSREDWLEMLLRDSKMKVLFNEDFITG